MMEISLTRGKVALINDADFALVKRFNWRAQRNQDGRWYALAWDKYPVFVLMHRVILDPPAGITVDHVNGDGLDNRRQNLRGATYSQNVAGGRPTEGRSSAFKGVSWEGSRNKWRAMIAKDGEHYFLGRFDSEVRAAEAYDLIAKQLYGKFAYQNFGNE